MAEVPTATGADIQQAARLLAERRTHEAVEILEDLVRDFPGYVSAHVLLARAYESAGREVQALQAWHQAHYLLPTSPLIARQRRRLAERMPQPPAIEPSRPSPESEGPEPFVEADLAPEVDSAEQVPEGRAGAHEAEPIDDWHAIARPPMAPAPETPDVDAEGGEAPPAESGASPAGSAAPPAEIEDFPEEPSSGVSPNLEEGGHGWRVLAEIDRPAPSDAPIEAEITGPEGGDAESDQDRADARRLSTPSDRDPWPFSHPDAPDEPSEEPVEESASDFDDAFLREADDLDSLIEQLENAPRIRPEGGTADSGDADFEDEVVTETLARIYESQNQFMPAARAYEILAREQPQRADEFGRRAAELRRRASG